MTDISNLIRNSLDGIAPYNSGLSLHDIQEKYGVEAIAKLASNENPNGPAPEVLDVLKLSPPDLYLYPDPEANILRSVLAEHLSVKSEQLIFGNGSEELISIICRSVIDPGDKVITLYPSFPLHEDYAVMMGAKMEQISVNERLEIDVEALIDAASKPAKMLIFANPMNPVGCWLNPSDLQRVITAKHPETLLVLDEAYYEYASSGDYCSSQEMLEATSGKWIILRTFSKAWGLAGLRIGFGICSSPELRAALDLTRTPFNINAVAQMAAVAALSAQDFMKANIAETIRERTRVEEAIAELGYQAAPSLGNFLFFDTGALSTNLSEELLRLGTVVKPWKQQGFDSFVRVSIGSVTENDQFINHIKSLRQKGYKPICTD